MNFRFVLVKKTFVFLPDFFRNSAKWRMPRAIDSSDLAVWTTRYLFYSGDWDLSSFAESDAVTNTACRLFVGGNMSSNIANVSGDILLISTKPLCAGAEIISESIFISAEKQ